jgi:hypothetical protein
VPEAKRQNLGATAVTDLDEQSKEGQQQEDGQQQQEQQQQQEECLAAAAAEAEASFFQRRPEESPLQFACRIFRRVYTTDIERVVSMSVCPWP